MLVFTYQILIFSALSLGKLSMENLFIFEALHFDPRSIPYLLFYPQYQVYFLPDF
jgi:hypothetical protein